MTTFKTRLSAISKTNGKIILANDYDSTTTSISRKTIMNIKTLHPFLCGIKLNFHLLLPLGTKEISKINKTAHDYGLQTIADIKLNDIGNTNHITTELLWSMGFDAVIVNPIMGLASLKKLVKSAHMRGRGVISLCHMSAPEARTTYEMDTRIDRGKQLYELFLDWAISSHVDGIIVGATFPKIIQQCASKVRNKARIFSPGVGTQGGDASQTLASGSDYLIVGRTILGSSNPACISEKLHLQSLGKSASGLC